MTLALGSVVLASCGGAAPRRSKLTRVPATDPSLERSMEARVNRDRGEKGLPPLAWDDDLADIARFHAADMREHRFFAHDSPNSGSLDDRMAAAGFLAAVARENLAEAPDVDEAEDGLLKSPGHFANLMAKDVTHIGVGIVRGGLADADNLLFVQVFAAPLSPQGPDEALADALAQVRAARAARGVRPLAEHPALSTIAERRVAGLAAAIAKDDLGPVAEVVVADVKEAGAKDVGAVTVSGTLLLHTSLFEPPAAALAPDARIVGGAAAPATDEKGRPAIVILLLVGR